MRVSLEGFGERMRDEQSLLYICISVYSIQQNVNKPSFLRLSSMNVSYNIFQIAMYLLYVRKFGQKA